jgi:hypothetical protein
MALDANQVRELIKAQLSRFRDPTALARLSPMLVEPYPIERAWDYGAPGEIFACWTLLEHRPSNTGIAYCESGFGPENPWGLVFLSGPHMGIGMDSAWFPELEIAFKESAAWEEDKPG